MTSIRLLLVVLVTMTAFGCARLRPARVPMATTMVAAEASPSDTLVILLPGISDRRDAALRAGLADAIRDVGVNADVVSADAHFGYYRNRSVITRIGADIIEPARTGEAPRIWVVGASLGGLGALLTARDLEGLCGVVALAPFLGKDKLLDEIESSGGPSSWKASSSTSKDSQVQLWQWLVEDPDVPIHLGFGDRDRFARGGHLLARLLPPERVHVISGDHDWETWAQLWRAKLDDGLLDQPCGGDHPPD